MTAPKDEGWWWVGRDGRMHCGGPLTRRDMFRPPIVPRVYKAHRVRLAVRVSDDGWWHDSIRGPMRCTLQEPGQGPIDHGYGLFYKAHQVRPKRGIVRWVVRDSNAFAVATFDHEPLAGTFIMLPEWTQGWERVET